MSTSDGHNIIPSTDVLYSFCTSDHIPICVDVSLELVAQVEGSSTQECKQISWDKFSDDCIKGYTEATKYKLENVNSPHDAIICNDVNYTDDAHISVINVFYDNIIESMTNVSDELVGRQGRTKPHKCRPGWNDQAETSILLPENAL